LLNRIGGITMGYSRRIYDIVAALLTHTEFTSWDTVSLDLEIAKRTVFREMKDVEKLITALGMTLHKKTRLGVLLEASKEQRLTFEVMYSGCDDKTMSQEARLKFITCELLKYSQPQKLFYYSSKLGVSEATISHDMDRLVEWFDLKGIQLIRKPGLGVYLEGTELIIRKALVDYLYENYEHQALVNLINYALEESPLGDGVLDKRIFLNVRSILQEFEDALMHRLTENAYTSLTIHLTIAVQRVLRDERIHMTADVLKHLREDIQFEIARAIGNRVAEVFSITFPEDELGYITMHLKGAKLKTAGMVTTNDMVLSNFEMSRLAMRMMKYFESVSGFHISQDEELLIGLVSHLKPAITRLKLALTIRNPLLDQIIDLYPETYAHTTESSKIIEKDYGLLLPASEIGYLAMHFGASIERLKRRRQSTHQIRVAIVCASGIGTSSLLASRIAKQFDQLVILGQFSKLDIESQEALNDIDLVLTTVSLDLLGKPIIHVSPLVTSEDVSRIELMIERLKSQKSLNPIKTTKDKPRRTQDTLSHTRKLHRMSEAVLQVSEGFQLLSINHTESLDSSIDNILEHLPHLSSPTEVVKRCLIERERLGSTLLRGENVMILHAKVPGAQLPYFGVFSLRTPYYHETSEAVNTMILMLMAEDAMPEIPELFSWISQGLIDQPEFLKAIRSADETICRDSLHERMTLWLEKIRVGGVL
jgi:mannitol operon transcriptional antiterminator